MEAAIADVVDQRTTAKAMFGGHFHVMSSVQNLQNYKMSWQDINVSLAYSDSVTYNSKSKCNNVLCQSEIIIEISKTVIGDSTRCCFPETTNYIADHQIVSAEQPS